MPKWMFAAFLLLVMVGAVYLIKGEKSDPIADMIGHTDNAILAFQSRDYAKFSEEHDQARSAYLDHGLYNRQFPDRSVASVRAGRCDDMALDNHYRFVSDLLDPLASAFSTGKVNADFLEFEATRLADILKEADSGKGEFSLSNAEEQKIEEGCDNFYLGYSEKRRAFDRYVFENIADWVWEFGRVAGTDIVAEAEQAASMRLLRRRLDNPNAWSQLTEAERIYLYGGDPEVRDCVDAAVIGDTPDGVSTSEIVALCKAGLR